ncbi:MAG: hypothetical protein CFH06_00756 [Alphaproteobacteria bacterium MarineAlpha3_Bin5]|nr:arylsulfatase [Magnetovibrio sp.]PPR78567.1 MAG: hypothetical protein CFH06_00756 [Alphaproteobacteria bacterium MarineAlpha3_Bin5]|tara:strand:- start:929 stop:1585 length:657 start_codon:yes stop_codon:yes gene_type:complete
MSSRIALIHALEASIEPIRKSFERLWPEAITANLLDDSLSLDLASVGILDATFGQRMSVLVDYALECGADGILFTCSAFGEAIEEARVGHDIPILKPDESMIRQALEMSNSIGILVTFLPTIYSVKREVKEISSQIGIKPDLAVHFVEGAMDALKAGDKAKHDNLVINASTELADRDIILLAQFSMAHLVKGVETNTGLNVMSSPDPAVLYLKKFLGT